MNDNGDLRQKIDEARRRLPLPISGIQRKCSRRVIRPVPYRSLP